MEWNYIYVSVISFSNLSCNCVTSSPNHTCCIMALCSADACLLRRNYYSYCHGYCYSSELFAKYGTMAMILKLVVVVINPLL